MFFTWVVPTQNTSKTLKHHKRPENFVLCRHPVNAKTTPNEVVWWRVCSRKIARSGISGCGCRAFRCWKNQVSIGRPSCGYLQSMGYRPCHGRWQEKNHLKPSCSWGEYIITLLLLLCFICICTIFLVLLRWRCRQSSTARKLLSTITMKIATCGWILGAIARTSVVLKTSGGTKS